jgi:hypothetical protein
MLALLSYYVVLPFSMFLLIPDAPCLEPYDKERKMEERNKKLREYRARRSLKKQHEREAKNKRQRDYRARKKVTSGDCGSSCTYI